MSAARAKKKGLSDWLKVNGWLIDPDAEIAIAHGKAGHIVTFSWSYDGRRPVRISFSGVTAEERKTAMVGWLNGDYSRKGGGA
jgi:hypothetical protein